MTRTFTYPLVLAATLVALAAGCGHTRPARFYTLHPLTPPGRAEAAVAGEAPSLSISLGPIEVPEYLNRPQIATRQGEHGIRYEEFERWAEPLEDNVPTVLLENLSALLPRHQIVLYPASSLLETDYSVLLRVLRFEGTLGQNAVLEARWNVLARGHKTPAQSRTSRFEEPAGDDIPALVKTQSLLLESLCRDIAEVLRELPPHRDP